MQTFSNFPLMVFFRIFSFYQARMFNLDKIDISQFIYFFIENEFYCVINCLNMNGVTVCRTNPQVVSVLTQKKKTQNWWWLQMKGRLLTNNSNNETEEGIRSNLGNRTAIVTRCFKDKYCKWCPFYFKSFCIKQIQ